MIIPLNNGITTSILDNDAREFIRVARISDETQIRAINELCKDFKKEGIWNSFNRAYPFVFNGTTASMLVCLKTRESLSFTSTTLNSITFSNTGVQFGLTSSVFIGGSYPYQPIVNGDLTRGGHISIYSRTNNNPTSQQSHTAVQNFGNFAIGIDFLYSSNPSERRVQATFFNSTVSANGNIRNLFTFSSSDNSGLYLYSNQNQTTGTASQQNPWLFFMSRNGQILGTASSVRNYTALGLSPRIGNLNYVGNISDQSFQEICWWSFGGGSFGRTTFGNFEYGTSINDNLQQSFYEIIQKFQTKLGRAI